MAIAFSWFSLTAGHRSYPRRFLATYGQRSSPDGSYGRLPSLVISIHAPAAPSLFLSIRRHYSLEPIWPTSGHQENPFTEYPRYFIVQRRAYDTRTLKESLPMLPFSCERRRSRTDVRSAKVAKHWSPRHWRPHEVKHCQTSDRAVISTIALFNTKRTRW